LEGEPSVASTEAIDSSEVQCIMVATVTTDYKQFRTGEQQRLQTQETFYLAGRAHVFRISGASVHMHCKQDRTCNLSAEEQQRQGSNLFTRTNFFAQ